MSAPLTDNAMTVLQRRYLARTGDASAAATTETPAQMWDRVARHVAEADARYGATPAQVAATAAQFAARMAALEFLPNSPTLMNAGRPLGQLAACFVVPVEDTTQGIFEAVGWAAQIQKTGGGTGFSFSQLRPAGDLVASTGGISSGPVAFMQVFDTATDAIKQGGTRRGANMGMLRVDHPDILEFIAIKLDPERMRNFNLSVAITDAFMAAVRAGTTYDLISPRTGARVRALDARHVLDAIVGAAWAVGDPGLVFIDRINATQPTPALGAIEATNPCVTGDTRVWVEHEGLVAIRDLVGKTPRIATFADDRVVFRAAAQVIATGIRPVYRLTTVEGLELRLTGDHLVATDHGDVPAEDLEPGDRIRLMSVDPVELGSRDSASGRLGEVVGWLTGDGHFTQHEAGKPTVVLSFYGRDKREAGPRLLEAVRTITSDPRLSLNRVESRDLAYVRSQQLLRALAERGVDHGCKTAVPELVWRGDVEVVSGYLRGLFSADGSVQGSVERGASVRLAANSLELLRGVQALLLRLGIRSVVYANRRVEGVRFMPDATGELREYQCAAQHELALARGNLRTFAAVVGFVIAEKNERLRVLLDEYRRGPYRDRAWVTVSGLVLESDEPVFDLTEPTTNHFFANGLLVHNCGEQPLLPFESCTLGSINLVRFVDGGALDRARLCEAIHEAVHFLDNVIDQNRYPLPAIETATRATRKIGLGVMGWADLLVELDIAYDSDAALALAGEVAELLESESLAASATLAEQRGAFPAWLGSRWDRAGKKLRNATTTTVAPTGTISIIAGCSSGIEPLYALAYQRHVLDGAVLTEVNPAFRRAAEAAGAWTEPVAAAVARTGRARDTYGVPAELARRFPTAHDVDVEWHVKMQAAWQRHVHAAVSKTINLRRDATPDDVRTAYELAFQLGCKGITVYRDGSREGQVLTSGNGGGEHEDHRARCPECGSALVVHARCSLCRTCGWSVCG